MTVPLILVSVFLLISILLNILFWKMLGALLKNLAQIDELSEELAFAQGDIEIPDELIEEKFLDAIVLCHIEKNPFDSESSWKIVDTSSYNKNHIIGLTYYVQPQMFEDLKESINEDNIKDEVRKRVIEAIYDDEDLAEADIDEEFIDELISQAYGEVIKEDYDIDEEHGTMTRPLMPHCTVYHLKDGRWFWRRESS